MSAIIIDGKKIAAISRRQINEKAVKFKHEFGFPPGLAVLIVGDDAASQVYVNSKHKACQEVGIYSEIICLPHDATAKAICGAVKKLNHRDDINGILVQLPLPVRSMSEQVIAAMDPAKDVDGFHPYNVGCLCNNQPTFVPCTPLGVMRMLEFEKISLQGKHAVVIGRSSIVGKPMAQLLLQADCTVTVCHSRTVNLGEVARGADIIVAAIGQPNFVSGSMIKPGAIVIDVGINRVEGKLVGDVDFAGVVEMAGYITPVPGGVGPMTIAMLLENTVLAAERQVRGK